MKIYIGSDHRGFQLKGEIKTWLSQKGYEIIDCGNTVYDKDDDFPDYSFAVADNVAQHKDSRGIVICGSGIGVTIAANKVKGIRCSTAINVKEVIHGRQHDDLNVLALSADYTQEADVKAMIDAFLITPFDSQERFVRRLEKIRIRER